jgi:hypothetical protein
VPRVMRSSDRWTGELEAAVPRGRVLRGGAAVSRLPISTVRSFSWGACTASPRRFNLTLTALALRVAREQAEPGSLTETDIEDAIRGERINDRIRRRASALVLASQTIELDEEQQHHLRRDALTLSRESERVAGRGSHAYVTLRAVARILRGWLL